MPSPSALRVARSELLLGADPAAKIARADGLVRAWLQADAAHRAVYIATAQAWDGRMRALIDGHRDSADEPRLVTVEEPTELAHALGLHSRPDTLIVVDCLTFWLTATLMQALVPDESDAYLAGERGGAVHLYDAVRACAGPLVLISHHGDAQHQPQHTDLASLLYTLDVLDQQAVGACERVTLMSGELPMLIKGAA
jgi:adenosylcobinamide kinase/adenosylcobinamide-phosphate guanylyltransferase